MEQKFEGNRAVVDGGRSDLADGMRRRAAHRAIASRFALWQFDRTQAATEQKRPSTTSSSKTEHEVDFSLWAEKRIRAYRDSLVTKTDPPLAVLEIDKLQIRVPVFEGTDDLTLNRGVGRIVGTAKLGETGNIGIAGHRDGFFRGLKDISLGDEVNLTMTVAKETYIVDQIEIVSPEDVRVLQPRRATSITLVTCYPFYFVGDAPKRFIVHASLVSSLSAAPMGLRGAGARFSLVLISKRGRKPRCLRDLPGDGETIMTKRTKIFLAIAVFMVTCVASGYASDNDLDNYRWRVEGNWWFAHPSGQFGVRNGNNYFDINRDFGFGDYSTFTGKVDWRFGHKHHFLLNVTPNNDSRTAILSREIVFEDRRTPSVRR